MRIFFIIRHILYHLTANDEELSKKMKLNPIKSQDHPSATSKWQEDQSYSIMSMDTLFIDRESILCNVRENQKMQVRYVMNDPDYFILFEYEMNSSPSPADKLSHSVVSVPN